MSRAKATNPNARYQREWLERNAKAIQVSRKMRWVLGRMLDRENTHMARRLAQMLREYCGPENAAHIAYWLQHPDERPSGTTAELLAHLSDAAAKLRR